jgi:hypothetical protein
LYVSKKKYIYIMNNFSLTCKFYNLFYIEFLYLFENKLGQIQLI